jgi:phosphoenolpyruvate-protein kinase (PTS system EI component)
MYVCNFDKKDKKRKVSCRTRKKQIAEQEKKKNTLDRGHRAIRKQLKKIRKQLKKKSIEEKTFVILNLRYPSLHICR